MWLFFFVFLPTVIIIGGIVVFNVYFRKQIRHDTTPRPVIDDAYMEAERTKGDDEDFGSVFGRGTGNRR